MNQMRVNWAVLTPSFVGFINPSDVPGLKTLTLAGEAMSESHIKTWSHINLVNGYGPSECSVAAVVNSRVTPGTSPTHIGKATGVRLWVVDPSDHNRLVPIGCVGELLVQGPTLARGYHGQADKTAEAFISTTSWAPICGADKSAWKFYKTGDLVRQCLDGTLMFIGRKDTQVKGKPYSSTVFLYWKLIALYDP
jgi:non-ribosomal peptide synthetase component F